MRTLDGKWNFYGESVVILGGGIIYPAKSLCFLKVKRKAMGKKKTRLGQKLMFIFVFSFRK